METDAFFCQLFKQLPETLFELIDLPAARAKSYRFDSVELKKAFRIDGLFVPKRATLPLYIVEVQFQRLAKFYANLFAKVFCYLEENDPKQEWFAVAIFPSRTEEPIHLGAYEDLLQSKRVKRIYLDAVPVTANPPLGLGILHLLSAPMDQVQELAPRVLRKARVQLADSDLGPKVVQLVERLLMSRFPQFDREEVRMKFKLHDIRESKVWKEAHEEGIEEGIEKGKAIARREMIRNLRADGMTDKQIAAMLKVPVEEIQRLSKNHSH
jgi:predicted transposase/invertase (TIGR01784 family)